MLRIHRNTTKEIDEHPLYKIYIKRYAMTDVFSFEVNIYGLLKQPENTNIYEIHSIGVTRNSFGVYVKDISELKKYELILWEQVYKDIKKDMQESIENSKKEFFIRHGFNNQPYLEREKRVLKEIGKFLRQQKLERLVK